jgi:hypothetical protein
MENPEASEDGFTAAALKGRLRRKINASRPTHGFQVLAFVYRIVGNTRL